MNENESPEPATDPELEPAMQSPSAQAGKKPLLPEAVTHPLTLLIAVAVPQLILLVINLQNYHLLSGEVDEKQNRLALGLFAGELLILVGGSALALWLWRSSIRVVPWIWNLVVFIPPIIFLTFFCMKIHDIVPEPLRLWIVQPENLIFYQFVFLMPSIFLAALGMACFPVRASRGKDVGISVGLAAGIPLFWYLLLQLGRGAWLDGLPGTLIFIMVVGSSLVCLTGVLRLLTLLFTWGLGKGQLGQTILIALVAIAAPIGGLLLNRAVPFPCSFQIWPVYALTILNGLFLIIPKQNQVLPDRFVWLLQCALLPFTLYFFLVFLPYLPLAAMAIIAAGAGFLILSPTALFVIHLLKIHRGLPSRRFWIYGILAALILPAYAQVEMLIDRSVLHRAIDYVYAPDLEDGGQFKGSRSALRRSLVRLQNVKTGVYLPFLTEWYNRSVLDGLVLNDAKMNHLYDTFFGEAMPLPEESGLLSSGWRGRRPLGRQMTPPPSDVLLEKVSHSTSSDPADGTRTVVKLEMHNPISRQSEFATTIDLPAGVFVSGYWLHIGDERVPGQIFEKKTAMWIYRMIRDASRRDPGLLTYLSPDRLSLRVFPFAAGETRITEIEFLSPPGFLPELRIGEEAISGESSEDSGSIVLAKSAADRQSIFVSAKAAESLPETVREPYLHFVVDRSAAGLEAQDAIDAMKQAARKFPEIKDFTVSLANYEFVDADPKTKPQAIARLDDAATRALIETLPLRGAFLGEHAMQRSLGRFRRQQAETESESANIADLLRFPILVLVTGRETPERFSKMLKWFQSATPDIEGYFVQVNGADSLQSKRFDGEETGTETGDIPPAQAAQAVRIFACGNHKAVVPAGAKTATASFPSGEPVEVYDSKTGKFQPLAATQDLPPESAWSKAIDLQNWESRLRWNPSRTDDLLATAVEKSRDTGFLTPSTAYIVVENSAQWKMLKKKEKEKLKANQALDFMETPEPKLWMVALIFGMLWWLRRWLVRRRQRVA